jgi:uncharacterized membrane protein (DUF485 family)
MASFLSDLSIQSWIVMGFFGLYIVYMLLMTYFSSAYRLAANVSSPWMFLYMVVLVVSYAIIVTVGVGCASQTCDKRNAQLCGIWSWLIAALVGFGVLYTIFLSMKANAVFNEKEERYENAGQRVLKNFSNLLRNKK